MISAVSYAAFALPGEKIRKKIKIFKVGTLKVHILIVIGFMTILTSYVIESGPTLITADYNEVLNTRMEPSPIQALICVMFGGFWSALFAFGRHKKILFYGFTAVSMIWLFLHSRRVEVIGIGLLMLLWYRETIDPKKLFLIGTAFILSLIVLETIRDYSLISQISEGKSYKKNEALNQKAALPGGASNVFLAGLHIVNVKDKKILDESDELTMLHWPLFIIPNSLLNVIGVDAVKTEHDIIFNDLKLQYVGGMPLLSVYYLNGGMFFVLIFGALHSLINRKVENVLNYELRPNWKKGGTIGLFIVVIFVVYQFRYHWYNPETMYRSLVYSLILYVLLYYFVTWKTSKHYVDYKVR